MDYIDINLYFKENLPFFKDLSESELKYFGHLNYLGIGWILAWYLLG